LRFKPKSVRVTTEPRTGPLPAGSTSGQFYKMARGIK